MKKYLKILVFLMAHFIAIGVIIYSFFPIARWYIGFLPFWGVDFFLTPTLTNLLRENLVAPFAFWNYAWFGGWPQVTNYPILSTYLVLLFNQFFEQVVSVQFFAMFATGLFLAGSYFLFYKLSKNFILSAILAAAAGLSAGVYQPLTWAGSLPSFTAQAFFPWVLFFLVWYFETGNFRLLLLTSAISGISIWGHQQIFAVYILPAVTLLIFTRFDKGLQILEKLKLWFIFLAISLVIGLPQFYSTIGTAAKFAIQPAYTQQALSTTTIPSQLEIDIANFNKAQVGRMVTDNHLAIFVVAVAVFILFIFSLVISAKISSILKITPFFILATYFAFYIWLFGQGVSIYHGGWYRLFWSVPIFLGALTSICWAELAKNFSDFFKTRVLKLVFIFLLNLLILGTGSFLVLVFNHKVTIWQIIYRSQVSSAHPDILNLSITDKERQQLKSRLVPSWINGDETNFRLYDGDQTVNLWWNSIFKMPLARGYLDPPLANEQKGYIFWLDAALSETDGEPQLVKSFGYPAETAVSNALFLLDWNSVRYYEGGHIGAAFTPVPKYLAGNLIKKEEVLEFNEEKYTKRPVTLKYSEIKEEHTSPILSATNSPTVGIFASDAGYETVIRAIAEYGNLNSQKIIPVKLGKFIDKYDLKTLKNFDSIYLYDYDYRNFEKAFKRLTEYVGTGKKVFIETGVEVKQSQGALPEFFPVKKVERRGLGKTWGLENPNQIFAANVNLSRFSPPIFDETEWKMSYATEDNLRDGATVILKNHGKIVAASQKIGSGEVIWSGLNFAYHLTRNHNVEEAKFFLNILTSMTDLNKKSTPEYSVNFINGNERIIKTEGGKGLLFKENAYEGWRAKLITSQGGKRGDMKIFKAGPSYPGFMFVFLPDDNKTEVKFVYQGSQVNKFLVLFSLVIVILILEEVAIGGIIFGRFRKKLFSKITHKVSSWWEREEE